MSSANLTTENEEQPLIKKKEKRRKVTVAVIALSNLCAWSCMSLIAPFFPKEAAKKGTNETIIGCIYASPELIIFIISPLCAKLLSQNSPKLIYISGLCILSCAYISFGWVSLTPPGIPFISVCFTVSILEGIGTAATMTASFAIAGNTFSDRIGTVFGILETMSGCGFLVGPAIGGGLYQLGGFGLSFWVLGSCVLLCGVASFIVIPPQMSVEDDSGPSSLTLFRSSTVWFGSVSLVVSLVASSVWEPVFAQYLKQFNLSQSLIGLIFVIPAATYTFTTPIWGILLDKNIPSIPVMVIGLYCCAVSIAVLGPAPFLTFISPMLWLTLLTIALLGFSLAPVAVSSMRCIVNGARELGFKDDERMFGLVGGIVQSSSCLGTFTGPMIGGAITDHFGFGWAMTVSSLLLLLPAICFSLFYIFCGCTKYINRLKPQERDYGVLNEQYTETSCIK